MRLISADELMELYEGCDGLSVPIYVVRQNIKDAPTIDAETVRHGHWINKRSSVYCSRCGKGYRNGVGTISALNHNYCPNCGAKMDEITEGNDETN